MRTIGILYFRVELPRSSVLEDYRRLSGPFFDINYCRQTSVRYRFFISPTSSRRFRGQVVVKKEKEKKKKEKYIRTRESATSATTTTTTGHYQRRQNSSGHRTEDKDDGHEARRGRHVVERDDVCR